MKERREYLTGNREAGYQIIRGSDILTYPQEFEDQQFVPLAAYRALEQVANTDELTGAKSRRAALTALEVELAHYEREGENRPVSVLQIDLNDFKLYNDDPVVGGHKRGDEVLQLATNVLRQTFRRKTDVVARYGGDELLVIAPDTSVYNAAVLGYNALRTLADESGKYHDKVAEQLKEGKTPQEVAEIDDHLPLLKSIGMSIGVATTSPAHTNHRDVLLEQADIATYRAKEQKEAPGSIALLNPFDREARLVRVDVPAEYPLKRA